MIRKAQKQDSEKAAVLIYDAIQDIAHVLTGERHKKKVFEQLERYFCQEVNRLSFQNCLVKTIDDIPVGIIVAYQGKAAIKLDEPIRAYLRDLTGKEPTIDPEADAADYYIDTVSVNPEFRGRGFGTELLLDAIHYAEAQGHPTVSLNVEENNPKARKLYESLGFSYKKTVMINQHKYSYLVKQL
ncbi:GNAT family N-acetyltransferase [Paenibacillus agricola]|uniref:GNAT family N-acetyltransferase n=1 Tax=Paenibacillus agricola TaxID=2716264 RepID=A0ABX0J5Q9_9BACL|nr:GNAT family N-acetyltransferase [Paenibacillus agricola]NHN31649.1 GNAT family N-acetyltransferase [Paenibacillus agricola]